MDIATKRRRHGLSAMNGTTATERLVTDFHAFVGDVEQMLKSASHLPGDSFSAVRTKLEQKVAQARAQLQDASSVVASGVNQARGAGETYLRDRPWTILGLALVIGTVAGMLLARKG
jgi:ElaB/YqjD/DUF883 family membrane-anchored ribosome-binding protein